MNKTASELCITEVICVFAHLWVRKYNKISYTKKHAKAQIDSVNLIFEC